MDPLPESRVPGEVLVALEMESRATGALQQALAQKLRETLTPPQT